MNTEQIKALDREKTVVLLPVGILEEHRPYLPSFSDDYITADTKGNRAAAARVLGMHKTHLLNLIKTLRID